MHRLAVPLFALVPAVLQSQASTPAAPASSVAERGVYATVFRSPSTGIELRSGHAAVHAGFYPTILRADGASQRKWECLPP